MEDDLRPLCRTCFVQVDRFPLPICDRCGVPLPGVLDDCFALCHACRCGPSRGFDYARAYGPYQDHLKRLIQAFKFDGLQRLAFPLAEWMLASRNRGGLEFSADCIVPLPLHPKRKRERGFDQTLLLSRRLSSALSLPVETALTRRRATRPQSGLSVRERRANLRGAFELTPESPVKGQRVILVDDVLTTGTTAAEASGRLKAGGAESVLLLTVARVELKSQNN